MNDVHNPFTPPKAEVLVRSADDVSEAAITRPTAVTIALFLLGVEILLSVLGVIDQIRLLQEDENSALGIALGLGDVAIMIVLAVFLARGRNWARIVFVVLWALSLLLLGLWLVMTYRYMPFGVRAAPSLSELAWMVLPHLLSLAIVILLFGPGRDWFRRRPRAAGS